MLILDLMAIHIYKYNSIDISVTRLVKCGFLLCPIRKWTPLGSVCISSSNNGESSKEEYQLPLPIKACDFVNSALIHFYTYNNSWIITLLYRHTDSELEFPEDTICITLYWFCIEIPTNFIYYEWKIPRINVSKITIPCCFFMEKNSGFYSLDANSMSVTHEKGARSKCRAKSSTGQRT